MTINEYDIGATMFRHVKTGNLYQISQIVKIEDPVSEEWITWIEYYRANDPMETTYYRRTEERFLARFVRVEG